MWDKVTIMCFTVFISFSSLRVQPTSPFLLYYCSEFVYDTSSFRLFFKLCNVGIIAGSCSTLLIILCSKTCLHLRQRSGGFFSSVNVNQEIRFLKWMQLIFDVCLVYFLMLKAGLYNIWNMLSFNMLEISTLICWDQRCLCITSYEISFFTIIVI